MDNKKKNNGVSWKSIFSIFLILVVFVGLMYYVYNKGDKGEYIALAGSGTEITVEKLVDEGKVKEVYVINGTGYIITLDSKLSDKQKERFPKYADYHFSYTSYSSLSDIFKEKDGAGNLVTKAGIDSYYEANAGESFINKVYPYLSILILIIVAFFIIRMFSGKGGANSFSRSKARMVEKSKVKFDDIAGADEEKEETAELVEFLKNPAKFKELGARIPKGALLVGPPGTGKTLLAKAVAGESNVPFFSISGSDFVELYVGVGASRVRDLFDNAKKNAPCIVFIDEIDAVGRQRGAGLGGGNDEREQTLNQLLVEMDGFESNEGIIVLAATNRADVLDPALLRPGRFDRQIYVNPPDVKGREGIIKIHAKNKPIESDVDFKSLARLTSGFTGADIENFLNEAAIMAARRNHATINMEDITEGINKVLMGPQKKSRIITEKDKRLTAYHEAGHAIIAKTLDTGDSVHEVSIIPRGMAGGYTSTRPADDENHYTFSKLNSRICMTMGGRMAEELVFGDITAGASSDIQRATEIAKKMVTEWGMSEKLGFQNFGKGEEVFIGRDYQVHNTYSEKTASIIDEEVKKILDKNYKKAKEILTEKRAILDNMANLLIEKETIYEDEVNAILEGKDYKEVARQLTEKLEQRKERDEYKQLETKLLHEEKMQELKEQTAAAFKKAGVISDSEFEMIKKETAILRQANEKLLKESSEKIFGKAEEPKKEEGEKKEKVEEPKEDLEKKETAKETKKKVSSKDSKGLKEKTDKSAKKKSKSKSEKEKIDKE